LIYFILDPSENAIKIGTTKSVDSLRKRIKTFACANPSELILLHTQPGGREEEARIHREFSNLRIRPKNEWFRNAGSLAKYLSKVNSPFKPRKF
jgi:Meiotically up-regulated gene 113